MSEHRRPRPPGAPARTLPRLATIVLALTLSLVGVAGPHESRTLDLPPIDRETLDDWACRAPRGERDRDGRWSSRADPLADGQAISYRQDPAVLTAAHRGPVALSEVLVAGDVPELRFRRSNPRGDDPVETWPRAGTAIMAGRLVSVFSASWPDEVFADVLAAAAVGPDYPLLFWGTLLRPGEEDGAGVYLRVASTALPVSDVRRIDDTAQYASHVVNLVLPDFASRRLEGGVWEVEERGAARRFYQHFSDSYEVLSFVTEPTALLDDTAWHRNVKNRVTGINAQVMDVSAVYGSDAGVLHGVEAFRDARVLTPRLVNHELSHQWGHYFEWSKLAGLDRHWPDSVHAPIVSPGHSLIGAKLWPLWRVTPGAAGDHRLGRTPAPIEAGPLELYAMGLLAAEDLPPLAVFLDQEQFAEGRTILQEGAAVTGETRTITGADLLGLYGRRSGPVPSLWRRALVVVSRDALLSQREMDYWNYHSARLEDANGLSPRAYEGYVSLDRATRGQVDLSTRIVPKALDAVPQSFDVDYPPFAADDCRAVRFSAPVATLYRVGERIRIGGTVTARDRSDFSTALLRFWPYGGAAPKVVRAQAEVSRGGDFQIELEFRAGQEGQFLFEVFLFWPGAGSQSARCTLSPVTVMPAAGTAAAAAAR